MRSCIKLSIAGLILTAGVVLVRAADVSLAWDTSEGATGYKIHYGFESGFYSFVVDIGPWRQCTISGLDFGQLYYFAVTAYDDNGESDYSAEIEYMPKSCDADRDSDGDIDGSDLLDMVANPSATGLSELAAGFGAANCIPSQQDI